MSTVTRSEILDMLAEGKITTAEALKLLDRQTGTSATEVDTQQPIKELKAEETALLDDTNEAIDSIKAKSGEKDDSDSIAITDEDLKPADNGNRPRWLKIQVRTLDTGRNKVNVTLPLGLVNFGLGVARRFGADFEESPGVWEMLKGRHSGELINVEDEEDNEQVLIYLE